MEGLILTWGFQTLMVIGISWGSGAVVQLVNPGSVGTGWSTVHFTSNPAPYLQPRTAAENGTYA